MIPDTASLWAGIRKFEEILNRDPQAYSFAPLADLYLNLGLLEDALQAARKGCKIHPDFAAGQMILARAALAGSLTTEAKDALEAVVRITPENLEAQRMLADLYMAAAETVAAQRCLNIVRSLEGILPEPATPVPAAAPLGSAEELADDDILELTDDLIEMEVEAEAAAKAFSADPERPSLGEFSPRAEPFLLETAPPFHVQEQTTTSRQPVAMDEVAPAAPVAVVASATIAELYASQGFPDRGAEVYREMLQREPGNETWRKRLAELSAPVEIAPGKDMTASLATETAAITASSEGVLETLCGWLANIGRIKECRTKSV